MRVFGEQNGGNATANTSTALIAPEVTQIQFRYFDGSQLVDSWDMKEQNKLPVAIEVAIWLNSGNADQGASYYGAPNTGRVYRQVVSLPMAGLSQSPAAGGATNSTTSADDSDSSTSSSTGDGASAFGEQ
jgi:hypothetical protein